MRFYAVLSVHKLPEKDADKFKELIGYLSKPVLEEYFPNEKIRALNQSDGSVHFGFFGL